MGHSKDALLIADTWEAYYRGAEENRAKREAAAA